MSDNNQNPRVHSGSIKTIRKLLLATAILIIGFVSLNVVVEFDRYEFANQLAESYGIALMYAGGHHKLAALRNYSALCSSLGETPTDPKRVAELVDFLADNH
jgi:hypothetical protein